MEVGDRVKISLRKYLLEWDMIEFERYESQVITEILDIQQEKILVEYQLFDEEEFWIEEEAVIEIYPRKH